MAEENESSFRRLSGSTFEWEFNDFRELRYGINRIESPSFEVYNSNWNILFRPNIKYPFNKLDCVSLHLHRLTGEDPVSISVTFSIKVGKTVIKTLNFNNTYDTSNTFYGFYVFMEQSELMAYFKQKTSKNYKSVKPHVPSVDGSYSFTIVCSISALGETRECNASTQTAKFNDGTKDIEELGLNEENSGVGSTDERKELRNDKYIQALSDNFGELFLNKEHCDVKIKVGPKEFYAHKIILVARSPVFASMFRHKMAEKVNGSLDISDCDPESFEIFLKFLYTGKTDCVCYSNALCLYKTADKYCVDDLKKECVVRLCEGMDVKYICDILDLASVHEEKELLEAATNFFIGNAKQIFASEKWQSFLFEKTALANDCLRKLAEKKL